MAKTKHTPDFQIGNLSDVGRVRDENQDFFGTFTGVFGKLVVVCDGMGGHKGGSIASRIAVNAFQSHFEQLRIDHDSRFELEAAFIEAQKKILAHAKEHPETQGMGTTAVALLIRENQWWIAHSGDSRIYLKRGRTFRQLTKDHSWVQGLVDSGALTLQQAAQHPKRNIITKALGTQDFMPDIQGPFTLMKGDTFLLCSDGLYEYFNEKELSAFLDDDPQSACQNMINQANMRGGDDNITAQILRSNIGEKPSMAPDSKVITYIATIISIIALVVSAIFLYISFKNLQGVKKGMQADSLSIPIQKAPNTDAKDATKKQDQENIIGSKIKNLQKRQSKLQPKDDTEASKTEKGSKPSSPPATDTQSKEDGKTKPKPEKK